MKSKLLVVMFGAMALASCGTAPQTAPDAQTAPAHGAFTETERVTAARTIFALSPEVALRIEQQAATARDREAKTIELLLVESKKLSPQTAYSIFGRTVTSAEISMCTWASETCLKTYNLSVEAQNTANQYFSDGAWGGRNDAYRHTYWNALMTSQINLDWAQRYADAHESETPYGPDKAMDLYNNQVGRNEGNYYGPGDASKNSLKPIVYNDVVGGRTYGFCGDRNSFSSGYNYYTGYNAVNCSRY